jgi:hypothetical protein
VTDGECFAFTLQEGFTAHAYLRERYLAELRPYLGNPRREDLTLELWIVAINEDRVTESRLVYLPMKGL